MFLNIAYVLIIFWIIGFIAFPLIGWFIHILLVLAVISILIRIIQGK
ncbi:MAG: lmo0937 family membrane protein [Candidatus Peregrinibacteria bacterium]